MQPNPPCRVASTAGSAPKLRGRPRGPTSVARTVVRGFLWGLIALFCVACGAPQVAEPNVAEPRDGLTIGLDIDPIAGAIRVSYHLHGTLPPRLRVAFPDRWAGRSGYFDDIVGVEAEDGRGEPLHISFNSQQIAAIAVGDADTVVLRYTVRPQRGLLTHATRFRALLSADRFFAPGHAIFAEPLDLGAAFETGIRVTTATTERVSRDTWTLRSTVDTSAGVGLDELVDAAWFAGRFARVIRARGGRELEVWVEERVSAGPQALGDLAQDVVEAQWALLGETIAARTTVVVLLREDDPEALNGAGRTGGFVLEIGTDLNVTQDGVAALVAHENLHRLNGHYLRFAAADEFGTMWFREGVTDYVSMRNAAAAGVIESTQFFRFVGKSLANYLGSPAVNVTASEVGNGYWADRDLRRFPYDKGALMALLIDLRLRADGAGTLEGFFAWLRERPDARTVPLSNATLLERLNEYSGADWTEFWSAYVLGNDVLPVFERLNAVGLEVVERVDPAPYYGFRTSLTVDGDWFVSHVEPGSPADVAGLRSGTALTGEPYMPTGVNAQRATVYTSGPRGPSSLHIPAGRGQRRTFALSAADAGYLRAFGLGAENE